VSCELNFDCELPAGDLRIEFCIFVGEVVNQIKLCVILWWSLESSQICVIESNQTCVPWMCCESDQICAYGGIELVFLLDWDLELAVVKLKLAVLDPAGAGAAGARPQLVGLFFVFRTHLVLVRSPDTKGGRSFVSHH
jgi:hypothetical protein